MIAQGRFLDIQNHLAMVCDSLWAINSMIIIPEMLMIWKLHFGSEKFDRVLNLPTEFEDWEKDVAVAAADVGELLGRILDWEASSRHSILANIQQEHFRRVVLAELKETLCNLNSLVLGGSAMGLSRDLLHSMNPLREDYSNVLKNEVVGREEDIEKLIAIFQQQQQQLVSSDSNGDDNNPFVVAMVGLSGIGKTTLAHVIYHNAWLRQQFHHRIWVDIPSSSSFKTANIIGKEFARSINNEQHCDQKLHHDLPLQALWEYVNEQLDGSRYFLVLHCREFDEVLPEKWAELKNILLRVGGPGSAVLITGEPTGSDFPTGVEAITIYYLNPLSEDAWVELFKRHAATPIPPSKQVKRLTQNFIRQPFSAKIVGQFSDNVPSTAGELIEYISMLAKLTLVGVRLNHYNQLLGANIFDTPEVVLHMLTADFLVPAEGLASDLLDDPDRILQEAIDESWRISEYALTEMVYLRMKVSKDSTTIPSRCRYLCLEINPRARGFRLPIMSVEASKKLITLILQEDEETTKEDNEEINLQVYKKRRMKAATPISKFLSKMSVRLVHLRMLIVETSMIQSLPNEVSKLVNLLYLHLSKNKMELLPESLFDLTNLRILSLLRCQKLREIPERIYKLKKLHILKLAYCTKLQQLPKSITGLRNLVELDVEGCCWLSKLPEDLVRFSSLRAFNVVGCTSLSQIPRGIGQSIGLRKLLGIFVGVNRGLEFIQLQALTNLQEIGLRNLERAEETRTKVLMGQQRLRNLSLYWDSEDVNESSESATPLQVLKALRPNVHLQRLEIISYMGQKFPYWMSKQELVYLDSLVEVRLINLKRCARLPSLGQLPNLEKLEISGMDLIKHIDETFYGDDGDVFPQLEELILSEMFALEKLSGPERKNDRLFPRHIILTLMQCPKLKEIDRCLSYYSYIKMRLWLNNETIWSDKFNWNNLLYITEIEIVGCQKLSCLPQAMRNLKNLTEMSINSCNNLATLVILDSLKVLHIYACPVLSFNLETFTTLSELEIASCPKMQNYYEIWRKRSDSIEEEEEEECK